LKEFELLFLGYFMSLPFKCSHHPPSPILLPFSPASMKMLPLPPTPTCISLHWGNEPSQDQELLLLLIPDKAILCYICCWSQGFPHVYFFVGCLVHWSSGGGCLVGWCCCSSYGVVKPFSSFSSFPNTSIGVPVLILMVSCKHPHPYE